MATRTRGRSSGSDYTRTKPRSDVYTGMLIISLLFLILGSVLLYLDYDQYPTSKPSVPPDRPPAAAPAQPGGGQPPGGG